MNIRMRRSLIGIALILQMSWIERGLAQGDRESLLGPHATGSSTIVQRPVSIDLLQRSALADIGKTQIRIDPADPSQLHHFTAGWSVPRNEPEEVSGAWVASRVGVVEWPIVRPQEFTLTIDLGAHEAGEKLPPQSLKVFWNGTELGLRLLKAGRQIVEFDVPVGLVSAGLNRLELMPNYWLDPNPGFLPSRARPRGVRIVSLVSSLKGEAEDSDQIMLEDGAISQPFGSFISWALRVPEESVLIGHARLAISANRLPHEWEGEFRIIAQFSNGESKCLLDQKIGKGDSTLDFEIEFDAVGVADDFVRLTFVCLSDPGADSSGLDEVPRVNWTGLRIEGTERELSNVAPDLRRHSYNVLIILFDSLRADHTEPYGSTEVSTPHMARLATDGVTFDNAHTVASWTTPSVASLLTSLYPRTHGLDTFTGDALAREGVTTLAEALSDVGYSTIGISNNGLISALWGFDQGFDVFFPMFKLDKEIFRRDNSTPEAQADFVWNNYIEPTLAENPGTPFFVYLHEIDPHNPYDPLPPFDSLHDFGYRGNHGTGGKFKLKMLQNFDPAYLPQADLRHLRSQYMGEVSFMDQYLGRILQRLDSAGLTDDTLVVFVSDHGEEFMEHGRLGHGGAAFEEVLRIPVIMKLPSVFPANLRRSIPMQISDIAPSILDLLGVDSNMQLQGRSLIPFIFDPGDFIPSRPLFFQTESHSSSDAIIYDNWKLIRENPSPSSSWFGEKFRLFDLVADPGEHLDQWPGQPVVGHALKAMLEWQHRLDDGLASVVRKTNQEPKREPDESAEPMDSETLDNLRALGYIK